ncbi:hypothetical protein CEXT_712871 [Caerostris extrusa]|uniref:Uncharacterized protein n=1 Tax=Caerostris extrusa TaxID=172846 RepID=A0AAV4YDJ3_CAEEX|nr:hypothetical protein CEXT_712871 [Caerostris extrusa]
MSLHLEFLYRSYKLSSRQMQNLPEDKRRRDAYSFGGYFAVSGENLNHNSLKRKLNFRVRSRLRKARILSIQFHASANHMQHSLAF